MFKAPTRNGSPTLISGPQEKRGLCLVRQRCSPAPTRPVESILCHKSFLVVILSPTPPPTIEANKKRLIVRLIMALGLKKSICSHHQTVLFTCFVVTQTRQLIFPSQKRLPVLASKSDKRGVLQHTPTTSLYFQDSSPVSSDVTGNVWKNQAYGCSIPSSEICT